MNQGRISQAVVVTAVLVLAACGGDDDDVAPLDTVAPVATSAPEAGEGPVTGPASITAQDQAGDGTSVTIDSVTLPVDGFIVVHADADGSPGSILGWSGLLPAGESTGVTVDLNEPIGATAVVHPMAHVDANGNGEYEFMPPDVTIDVPATTEDGGVAMLPITYTIDVAGGTDQQDAAASLQLVSTSLGDVLADGEGWIVYLFTPDEQGESTCYDACEANWPVVGELASVGEGLDPSLLATTTRTDGTVQATYNGWPLYRFAGDPSPGMTNGQGLNGIWWVIDAAGNAVGA